MNFWIIKSDPESYGWSEMKRDGTTFWDGVRNYQARNNLNLMKRDDIALFYHSNTDKSIMGEVKIVKEAYQDPTIDDNRWVAVDVEFIREYSKKLSLSKMKTHPVLSNIYLVKHSRLSVMPISKEEYEIILDLAL